MPQQPSLQTPSPRKKNRVEVVISPHFSHASSSRHPSSTPTRESDEVPPTLAHRETNSEALPPRTPSPRKRRKVEVWISPYFNHASPPKNARILPRKSEVSQAASMLKPDAVESLHRTTEQYVEDPACHKLYEEIEPLKPLLVQGGLKSVCCSQTLQANDPQKRLLGTSGSFWWLASC